MIQWKQIPCFENYQASSCGLVRSIDREVAGSCSSVRNIKGRILKPWLNNGRLIVSLYLHNKRTHQSVHRLIGLTFIGNHPEFDHKDRNPQNNRLSNLRPCTHLQNMANSESRKGTSRFKGVSWDRNRNKWQVHIMTNYKSKALGRFHNEIDAAKVYNEAAIKYFGEFAYLNDV